MASDDFENSCSFYLPIFYKVVAQKLGGIYSQVVTVFAEVSILEDA